MNTKLNYLFLIIGFLTISVTVSGQDSAEEPMPNFENSIPLISNYIIEGQAPNLSELSVFGNRQSNQKDEDEKKSSRSEYAGWAARAWAGVATRTILKDNVTFDDPTFGTCELSWDYASFGLGLDVEYKFGRFLGLDLGMGYTNMNIDFNHSVGEGTQTDKLGVMPIWFAINFHILKSKKIDIFIGPNVSYVIYLNDLSYNVPGESSFNFETTNEFPSHGFNIGADYWLSDDWGLNFAFRYQDLDADVEHNLPLDPTFITIGVSRKL